MCVCVCVCACMHVHAHMQVWSRDGVRVSVVKTKYILLRTVSAVFVYTHIESQVMASGGACCNTV